MVLISILYLLRLKVFWIFAIILFALIVIDIISFLGLYNLLNDKNNKIKISIELFYIVSAIFFYSLIYWAFYFHKWQKNPYELVRIYNNSGVIISFYLSKLLFTLFILLQFIISILSKAIVRLSQLDNFFLKKKLFLKVGFIFSVLIFLLLSYGMTYGRFAYHVTNRELFFKELPKSFDGLKIVQISDFHLGSFPNHENQIQKVVDIINSQKPDLILFTGDMVNSISDEMLPFITELKHLKSKFGNYAVLGNHDYGDYYFWKNHLNQQKDHEKLIQYHKGIGIRFAIK